MWETILSQVFILGLLTAGIRIATPLLLAALGEIVCEKAGILNIGIEGTMLAGSLAGFLGANYTGNVWLGLLAGLIAGGLVSYIQIYLSIKLGTDQVVNGIAINLFSLGLTSVLYQSIFGVFLHTPRVTTLPSYAIPYLSDLPMIGKVFFNQSPMIYLSWILVPIFYIAIFKTDFGLVIRAVGENPAAADSAGINIGRVRSLAVMIGSMMAGLAGAFLSVAQLGQFSDNMTAGRGFIALAVVIFGRWNPFGALLASLLFGIAYALQLSLQALGFLVPYQFLLMLPYVITMITIIGASGRRGAPATLGVPYQKA